MAAWGLLVGLVAFLIMNASAPVGRPLLTMASSAARVPSRLDPVPPV